MKNYARRIFAIVDGVEHHLRFMANELPFVGTEDDIVKAIEIQLIKE